MTDAKPVEMPVAGAAATVEEILGAIVARLDNLAAVLDGEYKWLQPKVETFRKMDDDGIDYELSISYITEAEATEKRAEDNLVLRRKNVDRHLENIQGASAYIRDIAETMRDVFGVPPQVQP